MKLNQKLIEQLRNGEIAVENNGTANQLIEVLKAAFPEYDVPPTGDSEYYSRSAISTHVWTASQFQYKGKPTFKISDFYQSELFTGWAKDYRSRKRMIYFKDDVSQFGFSLTGKWYHKFLCVRYSGHAGCRPATHEEIKSTLIEEAKRRGYKGGNTIKGIHGTTHISHEIISFRYDPERDRLLTCESCVIYEAGQWAEIVEQPAQVKKESTPIHYTVEGTKYSLDYQELKSRYKDVCQYSDDQFMEELPQIAHLACVVAYFKGLGVQATISDKGIIHELIHLMTEPNEPTNDLAEIREKFNKLIQLV